MKYRETGSFWERDNGLVCLGFRMLGMDSRFVALGEPGVREDVPLITCTPEQMQDAKWWGQWKVDGVVLFAWALPRYEPIARAIKVAGIKLFLLLDTDGTVSPHVWPRRSLHLKYIRERDSGKWFSASRALIKMAVSSFKFRHAGTLRHLEHADLIVLPSPLAKQRYRRFLLAVGREDLIDRLRLAPFPVTQDMIYDSRIPKRRIIIAVGRWLSVQKNTPLLGRVLEYVLQEQPQYTVRVIGGGGEQVRKRLPKLETSHESRVDIVGHVEHAKLPAFYQESQIILCTSYSEGFPNAMGEALCCGCSVVGDIRISPFSYYVQFGSGTLACDLSPNNFRDALFAEIDAWEMGDRDPVQISKTWTEKLHPDRVAKTFLNLA
jgi:glycosyltransferase involved in cell wall biosynthesis